MPERLLERLHDRLGAVIYIPEKGYFQINGTVLLSPSDASEWLTEVCPLESVVEGTK